MPKHNGSIEDVGLGMLNHAKVSKEVKKEREEKEESDRETDLSLFQNEEHGQGDDMAIRDRVERICDDQLGVNAERAGDPVWNQMNKLVARYNGVAAVATMFENWTETVSSPPVKPVSAFLRYLDRLPVEEARGMSQNEAESGLGEAKTLSMDLTYLSGGSVAFSDKQRLRLAQVLKEGYSSAEISSVFRTFLGTLNDDFAVSQAPKKFVETAEALCYTARRKKQDAEAQASKLTSLQESERLKAQAELEQVEEEEVEEEL